MKKQKTNRTAVAILCAALIVLSLAALACQREEVVQLGQTTNFTALEISGAETDELIVNQTSTGDIVEFRAAGTVKFRLEDGGEANLVGAVDCDSTLNVDGTAALNSTTTFATWQRLTPQTAISITANDEAITPTGSLQPLSAWANRYGPLVATSTAGDVLILYNISNVNIAFTDTGTFRLASNFTMAQSDTLKLICDGVGWAEYSRSNN